MSWSRNAHGVCYKLEQHVAQFFYCSNYSYGRVNFSYRLPKGGNRHPSQRDENIQAYQTHKRDYSILCSANPLPFPFVPISVCETCKVMELQPYFSISYKAMIYV